jgi:netrin receptor unc-5
MFTNKFGLFILIIINYIESLESTIKFSHKEIHDPCYDSVTGKSQRCMPKFENVAFNKIVKASSTCGQPVLDYCLQQPELRSYLQANASYRIGKYCDRCDSNFPESIRDAKYLTDTEESNLTCWLSSIIYNPMNLNISLTISFGKKYELTYISLHFCNHLMPDSLAIMKSMDFGKTWIPLQYFSSDCKKVYNRVLKAKITQSNEQEALCTDSHLAFNNRIGFSTLENRPSFNEFDTSPVLQDWITATDVKIVFNRVVSPQKYYNTNINNNENYLALSELAIGGRCKCNGHASKCILNK